MSSHVLMLFIQVWTMIATLEAVETRKWQVYECKRAISFSEGLTKPRPWDFCHKRSSLPPRGMFKVFRELHYILLHLREGNLLFCLSSTKVSPHSDPG
jgi:hypothetical protein